MKKLIIAGLVLSASQAFAGKPARDTTPDTNEPVTLYCAGTIAGVTRITGFALTVYPTELVADGTVFERRDRDEAVITGYQYPEEPATIQVSRVDGKFWAGDDGMTGTCTRERLL